MRIGLISDLHWTRLPPPSAPGWHGLGADYVGVPGRVEAAVAHFTAADVDLVAVCGDLAEHGDLDSLAAALGVLAGAAAPVLVVAGNHDVLEGPGHLQEAVARTGAGRLSLATPTGVGTGRIRVAGVNVGECCSVGYRARLAAMPAIERRGAEPLVLLSHYPVLSLAADLAARGLPYPGDLLDRPELQRTVEARGGPTVVLSGHVHARTTSRSGPVLQLSAGALVEPPYECALVDIAVDDDGALRVARRCTRLLGEPVEGEPVLVPAQEEWRFTGTDWQPTRVLLPSS